MAITKNSVDMINGPLWKKMTKFSLVYMLTMSLQQLYNAADVMVVGRFAGEEALAGVGTCSVLVNLFLNFIMGLAAGITIVVGQAIGESQGDTNSDSVSQAAHTSIALAIYSGLVITGACLLFSKGLLSITGVPENVMGEASKYLRVMALGYVPSLIYNFGSAILRAKGDTKRPLYIVAISGVINVVLNLVFVCVFKMAASGVALATVISKVFNAVIILHILCRENDGTRIYLKKIRVYKKPFLKILKLGLPSGIQSAVYSASNILVQSSVNSFGSAAIAGSAAAASITEFYNIMFNSVYQSSIVFTSQNYGARKFDRIKRIFGIGVLFVAALWGLQSLITFFFGRILIGFYATEPKVIEWAMRRFMIIGYSYGFLGFSNVLSGGLRGMGASVINMITSIIGVCGIRIVWILTVFKAIGTFESLFWCYPISWLGVSILHGIMFVVVFKKAKKNMYA